MIEEEFVQFETAKLLKAAGFPQDEDYRYYDGITGLLYSFSSECESEVKYAASTQSQAMRWLREEHKISVEPHITLDETWLCDAWEIKVIQNLNDEDLRYQPTKPPPKQAFKQRASI